MSTISAGTTSTNALVNTGDTTGNLVFQTNGTTTAMTIDTSQNVGIGTSSPVNKLSVSNAGANGLEVAPAGTNSGTNILSVNRSTSSFTTLNYYANDHRFYYGASNTEGLRLDTSGNLLVGTASASGAKLNVNGDVQQRGTNGRITQAVKGIGSTVSSITVDVGGGLDGTSYFVEISLSGYNGVYLRYIHTVYKTNSWTDYSPNVVQNLASSGVSVAYSSPSAGVLRYTITASVTYPVVQVKVTSGGTTVDAPTTISIS